MSYQFFTGAQFDPIDERDHVFEPKFGAMMIDWEKGFDIRNVLGGEMYQKDQGQSLSCVGQAWSYYAWVLQVLEMMKLKRMNLSELRTNHETGVIDISAKAIYSQIALTWGGAYFRDGAKLITNWGSLFENQVPSNDRGAAQTESFMRDLSWFSEDMTKIAAMLRAKEYKMIPSIQIDDVARAILENFGVVGGVVGSNNASWRSLEPRTPLESESMWYHGIFYGAFGIHEGRKFVATPNSWGRFLLEDWKPGMPPGFGWQRLYEDYFVGKFQFNPWTLTDKPNKDNMQPAFNYTFLKTLNYGNSSADIAALQKIMKLEGFFPKNLAETGYYGNTTAKCVFDFQVKYNIASMAEIRSLQGKSVGPKTRAKLNSLYSKV